MKTLGKVLFFLLLLGGFALVNLLVHELAHCLTMDAVGGKCESIHVLPGVRVWPVSQIGQPYPGTWNNYFGLTHFSEGAPSTEAGGLVSLMGSGSVAILSALALAALFIFRPAGWLRYPLLAQSLMFLDLLFYTILPHWFGLQHFFFFGGSTPEPLNGAVAMGIPEPAFLAGVLVFSLLMTVGCAIYAWKIIRQPVS